MSVGIDVAKTSLSPARWDPNGGQRLPTVPNTPAGFAALAQQLEQARRDHGWTMIQVTLEPTAGYELALAACALQQGWRVCLPNPRHVRDWAKGMGRRAKTDSQDGLLLARYGAERQLPAWVPLPTEISELERLLRRRADLEQLLRQERNRKESLATRPHAAGAVAASVERVIDALEQELAAIEEAIAAHLRQHAVLQQRVQRLRSVPGIGAKIVLPRLVLLARWSALTGGAGETKGLVASAGLDPQPFASGTSVRKPARISRMGDPMVRRLLFMGALGGVRGKHVLRTFYERLVGRGKAKLVALIAAARKILVWAWAGYRYQTVFTAERVQAHMSCAA